MTGYSNYGDPGTLQGKIVIWDCKNKDPYNRLQKTDWISPERVSDYTDSVFTIIAIAERENVKVFKYGIGDYGLLPAYHSYLNVYLVQFPSMAVIGFHRVEGYSPPSTITYPGGNNHGDIETPYRDWISSFLE